MFVETKGRHSHLVVPRLLFPSNPLRSAVELDGFNQDRLSEALNRVVGIGKLAHLDVSMEGTLLEALKLPRRRYEECRVGSLAVLPGTAFHKCNFHSEVLRLGGHTVFSECNLSECNLQGVGARNYAQFDRCDMKSICLKNVVSDSVVQIAHQLDGFDVFGYCDAAGSFGSFLAASTAANLKPDADAVDKFREVLRAKIEAALSGESGRFFKLGVDYHPDRTLAAAAEESGVKSPVFPWKTDMYFREDGIYVSEGYGQPQKKLEIA